MTNKASAAEQTRMCEEASMRDHPMVWSNRNSFNVPGSVQHFDGLRHIEWALFESFS